MEHTGHEIIYVIFFLKTNTSYSKSLWASGSYSQNVLAVQQWTVKATVDCPVKANGTD